MQLEDAIVGRRATRQYTPAAVDEVTLKRLLVAAVNAPSAVNAQPWGFTVVRDQALLDQVSRDVKAYRVASMPAAAAAAHVHGEVTDANFHIFYHAPALILISAVAQGQWIVEDCALAAQNLMLAACGAGLGSCWIGLAQGWLNTPEGKRALDMPTAWVAVAPIIVGHPAGVTAPVSRNEPVVRWL